MDYETPDAYSETTPVAKKPYRCCECHGVIPTGTKHFRFSGVWDGKWRNYRTCTSCEAIRACLASLNTESPGSYEFGALLDDLSGASISAINPNLLLTVLYNGGISGLGRWSQYNESILEDLYAGKAGYKVVPFRYPYSIMTRFTNRVDFRLLNNENEYVQTLVKGEPLCCLADCGVFEVLAVIKTAEELALFTDTLDTRPKQFFTIHPNYLAHVIRTQSAISPSNAL